MQSAILGAADTENLIACSKCDRLHVMAHVPMGRTARCARCHTPLLRPRRGAIALIVSLSLSALVLMVVAVTFPFLHIEASGLSSRASVMDAILSFAEASGLMAPLSVAVGALIVALPVLRLTGLIYALGPIAFGHRPQPQAARVFRMAMRLRPWAMAEIFIIGVAVALIKIAALATVGFGPAFWAFAGFVLLIAAKDTMVCERSLWRILGQR